MVLVRTYPGVLEFDDDLPDVVEDVEFLIVRRIRHDETRAEAPVQQVLKHKPRSAFKLCSDQAKAKAIEKIFFDVCRLFFDPLHLFFDLFRFRLVWIGLYTHVRQNLSHLATTLQGHLPFTAKVWAICQCFKLLTSDILLLLFYCHYAVFTLGKLFFHCLRLYLPWGSFSSTVWGCIYLGEAFLPLFEAVFTLGKLFFHCLRLYLPWESFSSTVWGCIYLGEAFLPLFEAVFTLGKLFFHCLRLYLPWGSFSSIVWGCIYLRKAGFFALFDHLCELYRTGRYVFRFERRHDRIQQQRTENNNNMHDELKNDKIVKHLRYFKPKLKEQYTS